MLTLTPYTDHDPSCYLSKVRITPSPEQGTFFTFLAKETRSVLLVACAGSGKTTTIVEATRLFPMSLAVRFIAFNKSIAEELKSRLPITVNSSTFHSAWFRALQNHLPSRPKVDANKVKDILKRSLSYKEFETYFQYVSRLVGYAKNIGIGVLVPNEEREWFNLISYFSLVSPDDSLDESVAVRYARETLAASNSDTKIIDFDDMLYLALLRNVSCDKSNVMVVDEAQDLNAVQRTLLKRMLAPNGRIIGVGDERQAIYGFRGADSDSMQQLRDDFDAAVLPLSVSFRCSKAVVAEVNRIFPGGNISSHPNAPSGSVQRLPAYTVADVPPQGAILCRNTAPLISFAYSLLTRSVACRVLGREIGRGLVLLIEKLSAKSLDSLEDKLAAYCDREIAKALSRGQTQAAEAIEDKATCIRIFIDNLKEHEQTIRALTQKIESLFSDDGSATGTLTLCTIHKSKGLEWELVFLLDRDLIPSKYAKLDWQKVQEDNLLYVAITRAKLDFKYIQTGNWKSQQSKAIGEVKRINNALLED